MGTRTKERPILFGEAMVQALRDKRKTQTRRVINPQPCYRDGVGLGAPGWAWRDDAAGTPRVGMFTDSKAFAEILAMYSPYGVPGDRLWVREAWNAAPVCDGDVGYPYARIPHVKPSGACVAYAADGLDEGPWRPSIHMPRWASRIMLEVVNVRVERVQDISEADAQAEGAELGRVLGLGRIGMLSYREGFCLLWDSINAARGLGWDANPYVWVVEFKVLDGREWNGKEGG